MCELTEMSISGGTSSLYNSSFQLPMIDNLMQKIYKNVGKISPSNDRQRFIIAKFLSL